LDGVGRHLVAEVMFDAQYVGANTFAAMRKAVAVALQPFAD
jgi:hypothetical protein